ncbi:MAG: hypothetical protein K6E64_00060, partial [Lachnospiraceae bacterium]|nr:hypothetical protein [Lachnospiraceae bacterium]
MKKNKKIILIITILVALILLGGCVTWYVLNNNEQTDNESAQDVNVSTSDTENNLETDEQKDINDMSPEELFQAFCDGKITAEARSYYDDTTWTMDNTSFQFEETTPEEE